MIAIINIPSRGSSFPWKDNIYIYIYTLWGKRGVRIFEWFGFTEKKERKKKEDPVHQKKKKKKDSLITFKSNKRVIALEIM